MTLTEYIIDSSSLMGLNRNNPMDIYPSVWKNIEILVRKKQLFAPKEVYKEIKRGDDILCEWAKSQKGMFVEPTKKQIEIVTEILEKYPGLAGSDHENAADPWIIAMAIEMIRSRQSTLVQIERVVVTEEKAMGSKTKIPYVCQNYNLECVDIFNMFRREGWRF